MEGRGQGDPRQVHRLQGEVGRAARARRRKHDGSRSDGSRGNIPGVEGEPCVVMRRTPRGRAPGRRASSRGLHGIWRQRRPERLASAPDDSEHSGQLVVAELQRDLAQVALGHTLGRLDEGVGELTAREGRAELLGVPGEHPARSPGPARTKSTISLSRLTNASSGSPSGPRGASLRRLFAVTNTAIPGRFACRSVTAVSSLGIASCRSSALSRSATTRARGASASKTAASSPVRRPVRPEPSTRRARPRARGHRPSNRGSAVCGARPCAARAGPARWRQPGTVPGASSASAEKHHQQCRKTTPSTPPSREVVSVGATSVVSALSDAILITMELATLCRLRRRFVAGGVHRKMQEGHYFF
jgi:hypothetical protein